MQWLAGRRSGPLSDERGFVGVFVAISIVVMLGMVGLAVDVGAMYHERRQLRNGADAAVLAIAEDCALGVGSCDESAAAGTASLYASDNASDGASAVDDVDLDFSAKTVYVETSTLDPDGGTVVEPYFSRVVGFDGATVHASAKAQWGYPSALQDVLPLVISECEFPHGEALPTPEKTLYFHDGNNAEPCNAQAGQDADGDGFLAGGFGWLQSDGDCGIYLAALTWIDIDPGSSPSTGCIPEDIFSLVGEKVPLPIFDDLVGVGTGGEYHISGFTLFEITGFNFGGEFKVNPPCGGDERCLSGFFTTGIVHEGEFGGEDRGIVIVKLIG
jgi:hypothetical protein